ncbi:DUF1553 domain-containing protein [Armatimonas sp.]|uniref:DUF1553 domain-containing protein n=1 Tax=Armatimonas sp. TaxID=1872638 RepID=UPI00286ABA10|nr:DUF1553 domain-containing protein [Armatimonas sp.]
MNRLSLCLLAALPLALSLFADAAPPKPRVSYTREIRPILAENCFLCHGPDPGSRQANLRLDQPNAATKKALLARIMAPVSDALHMPPVHTKKTLTPIQVATVKQWLAQGAVYEKHWAFGPLAPTSGGIDRYIRERLVKEKLKSSPEASQAEWLRRVSLDLTGLPPSIVEADAFFNDKTPSAYEKVVDRLLASPHFGEQMALPWLDVARYGDSYGYQSDQLSTTWPWRDWVVSAFNKNLPYDQFITQQLAGDLLPNATKETRLATAFNRLHRMTNEGGSVPEEWRLEYVADRVRTLGTAFLGLTLECARCHDHKYDPIKQSDFYGLSAFFNSIDEHGLYDSGSITPTPSLLLPTPEQEKALEQAKSGVAEAEKALLETKKAREAAFQSWLKNRQVIETKEQPTPDLVAHFGFETLDGVPHVDNVPLVEGKVGKAAQLDGDNNINFGDKARFTRHTPFAIDFWMRDGRILKDPVVVYTSSAGTDAGPYGYDLMIENGILQARMMRHWPGNALAIRAKVAVPANEWVRVTLTYDGSSTAAGIKLYTNGAPLPTAILRDHIWKGTGTHALAFGQRFRDKGFKGGLIDELSVYSRALTPLELAYTDQPEAAREYYFSALDTETRAAQAKLTAARERVWRAEDPILEVMAMEELPTPRPSYVLARGAYDAPKTDKNRVGRITPAFLPTLLPQPPGTLGVPITGKEGRNVSRLALARWLTRPDHPLTARVAVNRFWQQFFGRGLVESSEDFGIQGQLPSHPELLDWLAKDFQRDWNVKRLIKQMVLSATYRQSSALRPELQKHDPQNILLARGPSYRLSAETIRDVALAASGLLDAKLGGAPVSPYQPGDLWREANTMSPGYRQSVGGDLYRRSLYTVWKRTAPMPNMMAFDASGREVCTARRQNTSTPLQALVLLNDPQFVEAARVLGERVVKEGGTTDSQRVVYAFRTLATRPPTSTEARLLEQLYAAQRQLFTQAPAEAAKLLTVGEKKPDSTLSPIEVAAATTLAQAILNLDVTIWKR